MKKLILIIMLSALFVSCGKKSGSDSGRPNGDLVKPVITEVEEPTKPEEPKIEPKHKELGAGIHKISCFHYRPANVYISTTWKIDDRSGQVNFEVHSKPNCTSAFDKGKFEDTRYETVIIDDVTVLEINLGPQVVYVPYHIGEEGSFMDPSHIKVNSKGYQDKPDSESLAKFRKSPKEFTQFK